MTEQESSSDSLKIANRRPKKLSSRATMLLRRVHLYVGLFLLPWVFLYGITGAMFNHQGLLPEIDFKALDSTEFDDSAIAQFPAGEELAEQVIDALLAVKPDLTIELDQSHSPEFSNNLIYQVEDAGTKRAIHIDPASKAVWIATHPTDNESLEPLLSDVGNLKLDPSPYHLVRDAVPGILASAGVDTKASPQPMGWSKLNFLATVNGQLARVTYVLRDGHVDITKYEGQDGMSTRRLFLRLHTAHGQPPHWNGRRIWSLFVDVMSMAMVTWGATGLVMWWQIKRTRMIGGVVILLSVTTAVIMYFSMLHFYATTKM